LVDERLQEGRAKRDHPRGGGEILCGGVKDANNFA